MEINSNDQKDRDEGSGDGIHNRAERRPPARIRDESGALLPKIFDAVSDQSDYNKPWRGSDCNGGEHDEG
jgi:hypothetical protein